MTVDSEYWAEERSIDFREMFMALWQRRYWIAAVAALFAVASVIVALLWQPVYRAATVMVPAVSERNGLGASLGSALGQLGGLASIAGLNLGGGGNVETEEALAVLKSREFTEAFIRERQLMPLLFPTKWDEQRGAWKADVKPPTPAQAYKYFNKKIRSVLQDKKTGLITLQIDWHDRQQAATWANELVERLNAEMRSRAIEQANASVGYLERELKATSTVATQEAINRLIESQIKQRMLANVTKEYAFRIVDRAMAPDRDDPIRPRRRIVVAVGTLLGVVVGTAGVLLFRMIARLRAESTSKPVGERA